MDEKNLAYMLGKIGADIESLKKITDENSEKLDQCMKTNARLESIVEAISPEVKDYTHMKQRGWGVIATLGLLATVFGTFVSTALTDFLRRFYGS